MKPKFGKTILSRIMLKFDKINIWHAKSANCQNQVILRFPKQNISSLWIFLVETSVYTIFYNVICVSNIYKTFLQCFIFVFIYLLKNYYLRQEQSLQSNQLIVTPTISYISLSNNMLINFYFQHQYFSLIHTFKCTYQVCTYLYMTSIIV